MRSNKISVKINFLKRLGGVLALCVISGSVGVNGIQIEKCEIAAQLNSSNVNEPSWNLFVCLADELSERNTDLKKVSDFNTPDAEGCGQRTLGLFQIPDLWCFTKDHPEFGSCKMNGCNIDCLKLLDDKIADDTKCVERILETGGISSWPQMTINKCNRDKWSYDECLVDSKFPSIPSSRKLTIIPLWATIVIVAISCLLVFSMTYMYFRHQNKAVTTLSSTEIKQFKYGKIKFSRQSTVPTVRISDVIPQNTFAEEPYNTDFEMSSSHFFIDRTICLGSGAYGIVYKGSCNGKVVAVKTVKPHATKEYYQSLLGEIKILSHIGRNDGIVNLEGAFTKNLKEGVLYVFMEYCRLGNLERFLRANRSKYVAMEDFPVNDELSSVHIDNSARNRTSIRCLTLKHLLQYAHQVAKGMEFLSTKMVIHSDLAARNVLLVDENTAKISDFGLSRKLYGYINYIKKKEEPLPWRWMAIESLKEMNFSTSSDIWMYGVLLFEIFSLGEVPYPGLSWSLEFVDSLENGFRMLQPKFAPIYVYHDVMLKCWDINPKNRPAFGELAEFFYEVLERITATDYVKMIDTQESVL